MITRRRAGVALLVAAATLIVAAFLDYRGGGPRHMSAVTPSREPAVVRARPVDGRAPVLSPSPYTAGNTTTRVLHVLDGDTIILSDGRRVRYIGIDTPERTDERLHAAAEGAREANLRLVGGQDIRLETDVQETDRYGRLLAYVWVGDTFVNEALLREGWARLLTIPPDVRYLDRLRVAADAGAERRAAFWGAAASPAVAGSTVTSSASCPADRPIKGNISRTGEKIFHVPDGDFYARTIPEECFGTRAEAERAGYRASRR